MPSLEELYALAQKEKRAFFPGFFSTCADATRLLLPSDCRAEWQERGSADRPRCGFLEVTDTSGAVVQLGEPVLVRLLVGKDPSAAWEILAKAPELDPAYLGTLGGRLVELRPDLTYAPVASPRTFLAAVALAQCPKVMQEAEVLVHDAFVRAKPFGVGPCPPIVWRTSDLAGIKAQAHDRSAFSPLHGPLIEGLGYGVWMSESHEPKSWFSFTRHGNDIPNTLEWVSRDMGAARQFDLGQRKGVLTKDGSSYADGWNPFEMLLRIAFSGILVESITPDRAVLVIEEP